MIKVSIVEGRSISDLQANVNDELARLQESQPVRDVEIIDIKVNTPNNDKYIYYYATIMYKKSTN